MRKKMSEIKVDIIANTITVTKGYYKRAQDPNSNEYRELQEILVANPNCKLVKREIKRNSKKECYRGLTYEYMKKYIVLHETKDNAKRVLAELDDMIFTSEGHSKGYRYPTIKAWFLEMYPNFATFGVDEKKLSEKAIEEYKPIVTKIFEESANLKSETEVA